MSIKFVPASSGSLPDNAFAVPLDGQTFYIGRALHQGSKVPGAIHGNGAIYISWGGEEHSYDNYEVLVQESNEDNLAWIDHTDGFKGAIQCGLEANKVDPLYVGRAQVGDSWLLGKVSPKYNRCYVPHEGAEVAAEEYQVLCFVENVVI